MHMIRGDDVSVDEKKHRMPGEREETWFVGSPAELKARRREVRPLDMEMGEQGPVGVSKGCLWLGPR